MIFQIEYLTTKPKHCILQKMAKMKLLICSENVQLQCGIQCLKTVRCLNSSGKLMAKSDHLQTIYLRSHVGFIRAIHPRVLTLNLLLVPIMLESQSLMYVPCIFSIIKNSCKICASWKLKSLTPACHLKEAGKEQNRPFFLLQFYKTNTSKMLTFL